MHGQYTKSETYQLIDKHLLPEINGIVWDYLVPDRFNEIYSCDAGKYGLIEFINNYNYGLLGACKNGHMELVNRMIELGANCDRGLYGACQNNHMELADRMIELGADDFNWGLYGACKNNHMELANRMIELDAYKSQCIYCHGRKH